MALARIEQKLAAKAPTRQAPPPETRVKAGVVAGVGLSALKDQAQKTGDYSAYHKAKRAADLAAKSTKKQG